MMRFQSILCTILFYGMAFSVWAQPRPNIILAMADDMGWGDPGYNSMTVTYADGTPHPDQGWIETPTMDTMAANGIRFDRFYSASAVCSPTRASSLTGRNPYRVGIPYANTGKLGFDETPLSEVLSAAGYRTGHFGKWHLGSMTTLRNESNRGGNASVYSAPWHHSYDVAFATESKVPTYHPYRIANNNAPLPTSFDDPNFYGTYYWRIPETWNTTSGEGDPVPVDEVNNAADGDDSRLMVEQAIPFIRDSVSQGKPFFVVLWFHTPHKPVTDPDGVSGVDSSDAGRDSIEDMDVALGMLRDELETLGVRGDTMFWVTSDNGPENGVDSFNETSTTRSIRSGRLRARKRSLYEGGVRVPGILEWPDAVASGFASDMPVVTSDYYSTILDILELSVPGQKPLDGVSLRPLIETQSQTRSKPIGFKIQNQRSWVGEQYKLINEGSGWELYDLVNIPAGEEPEQTPVATEDNVGSQPQAIQDVYNTMLAEFQAWEATLGVDTPYVHSSQPTATLSTPAATVPGPFTVTATFSEAVFQLKAGEIVVENGAASGLSGSGTTWTFTVTPVYSGDVTVTLPEGTVIDSDGNLNAPSNDLTVTYSNPSQPDVSLTTPESVVHVDTTAEWRDFAESSEGLDVEKGYASPSDKVATFTSRMVTFNTRRSVQRITIKQSDDWLNWQPVRNIGPDAGDAPILLRVGPGDYWYFGLRGSMYHAFRSHDMESWKHYGPVLDKSSRGKHKALGRWCISAEYADGKAYIYYDHPNDQDPHLIIDEDLTDGKPGKDMGLAFADPSDGSDAAVIRDLDGRFHLIYEDWSPINARKYSWDSPLAGHAVSDDGIKDFKILNPAVDERTTPTGTFETYQHLHWKHEHPDFTSNTVTYEVHEPEQDAYGDWAAIAIGGQVYLFGDYHPRGKSREDMSVAWFTASDINQPFRFCGSIGKGHPDPDVIFAEGRFYLVTQMPTDYISPGPWVKKVEVRVGLDTRKDGKIDTWTQWREIKETYRGIEGFSKQVHRTPASIDLSVLPAAYGFRFEFRIEDTTGNSSKPVLDRITISFDDQG
jgi:arylsulfatase A-like enzyme